MIFEHPELLYLAPLLALATFMLTRMARQRRLRNAALWSAGLGREASQMGRRSPLLLALATLSAALALAGPRWGLQAHAAESRALDVVLVMDISRSMLAQDVTPDRLQRAVGYARRLVQDLEGDRLALVVFAARGYLMVPLTLDQSAILIQLDALDPGIASEGGSGLVSALDLARRLLAESPGNADRAIVAFTDGESFDGEEPLRQAGAALRSAGITLATVPVGTPEGARIPEGNGRWHLNSQGQEVLTQRRDDLVEILVQAADGVLIPADAADPPGAVRQALSTLTRTTVSDQTVAELVPRGWIFALIAALLLLGQTLTRRSASLVGIMLALSVGQATAQKPAQGPRLLQRGDTAAGREALRAQARNTGSDTAWYNVGTAALAGGDYDEAVEALNRATVTLDPRLRQQALYNLGTARLAQARQQAGEGNDSLLKSALGNLRQALSLDPRDTNAKFNYELARLLLPPPPPPQPQSSKPQQSPEGDDSPPRDEDGQKGMSRAEADQVLNAMERAERNTRQALNNRQRQMSPPTGPDW